MIQAADATQPYDTRQQAIILPLSCTCLMLGHFGHVGTFWPLDKLSNLQELHI